MIRGWKSASWLGLVLAVSGTGCSKTDPDTMGTIARKLADRSQPVSDNLEQTWAQFSGRLVIESRVKARLHWDKNLAEVSIEVHATDKTVELKGFLTSAEQVRRAVELAESTLGVEKVVNSLHVVSRSQALPGTALP